MKKYVNKNKTPLTLSTISSSNLPPLVHPSHSLVIATLTNLLWPSCGTCVRLGAPLYKWTWGTYATVIANTSTDQLITIKYWNILTKLIDSNQYLISIRGWFEICSRLPWFCVRPSWEIWRISKHSHAKQQVSCVLIFIFLHTY